jgi:hypothetical protein
MPASCQVVTTGVSAHSRLLPLLISAAFTMETLDGTLIATPLPLIARDLGVDAVQAKSALTSSFLTTAASGHAASPPRRSRCSRWAR